MKSATETQREIYQTERAKLIELIQSELAIIKRELDEFEELEELKGSITRKQEIEYDELASRECDLNAELSGL